jgi:mevalonate kinase
MERIAESGCTAAGRGESEEFLHAVERYGRELEALGHAMGAEIVTAEHRALAETARRFGVIYKVSGAGGGDLGLGLGADAEALAAFRRAAEEQGFAAVDLGVDRQGLVIEERRQ